MVYYLFSFLIILSCYSASIILFETVYVTIFEVLRLSTMENGSDINNSVKSAVNRINGHSLQRRNSCNGSISMQNYSTEIQSGEIIHSALNLLNCNNDGSIPKTPKRQRDDGIDGGNCISIESMESLLDEKLKSYSGNIMREMKSYFESTIDAKMKVISDTFDTKVKIEMENIKSVLVTDLKIINESNSKMSSELSEVKTMNQHLTDECMKLKETLNTQQRDISNLKDCNIKNAMLESELNGLKEQYKCLGHLDKMERANKLVIGGIPASLPDGVSDGTVINAVFSSLGFTDCLFKSIRIGKNVKNMLLVTLCDFKGSLRDGIVNKAKLLQNLESSNKSDFDNLVSLSLNPKSIFIKKDLHPEAKKEWGRLNIRLENEKRAVGPEQENNITLDPRKRKIFKNGIEIDSWQSHFY